MKYKVKRYDFNKQYICDGEFHIIDEGQSTTLKYFDNEISIEVTELYHPLASLKKLRSQLENNYESIIGIEGCRIDVTYRATGHFGQYIMESGKPATISVNMFEPTNEVDKLCKEAEQEEAYYKWFNDIWYSNPNIEKIKKIEQELKDKFGISDE
ncbi:MAG: hypothetical protein KAX69_02000 [Chitinophagales bacterium]|nr:hypothetical protein [Chitinophagales bacterium]